LSRDTQVIQLKITKNGEKKWVKACGKRRGIKLFKKTVDLVQSISRAQEVIETIKEALRKQSNEVGTSNESRSKEGDHEEEKEAPVDKTDP
jgi:hypothetical protein